MTYSVGYCKPPKNRNLFQPGNKAAVGHGPWKKGLTYAMLEMIELAHTDPARLVKLASVAARIRGEQRKAQEEG